MKSTEYSDESVGTSLTHLLRASVSAAAMGAMLFAAPAMAQVAGDSDGDGIADDDEIVAVGIRRSLETSQDIKRDADTFVDSITASDIGALPDRSVLEALQRVPGISISRFAGGDDPDHFSVEGSGVVIRGLDFVRSEFNGRDAFSANNGRSLGFQDVPPELVGGVDVFKNQTADMVEGGISGVVNLKTLVPFDRADQTLSVSVDGTYTDFREGFSPSVSALYSNRWDTDAGEFGFLANLSYGNLKSKSSGFRIAPPYPYNAGFNGAGSPTATDNIAAPAGASIQDQEFDRDRFGVALAGQWESNDGRSLATAQFIRSEASNAWVEHTIQAEEAPGERAGIFAVGDFTTSPFTSAGILQTRDDNTRVPVSGGLFTSGVITNNAAGWTGRNGIRQTMFTRVSDTDTVTSDYSLNYKFTPNDSWKLNADIQFVDSTTENSDISVFSGNFADIGLDLRDPDSPSLEYIRSTGGNAEGLAFTDPTTQYWRAAMDHFEDSEGDELALRGDVQHDFNSDGWFKSVRVGARYAKRDQTTRWTEYNWQNLSEAWNGGYRSFADTPDSSLYEVYDFADFRRGDVLTGNTQFLFPSVDLVSNYRDLLNFAGGDYLNNSLWSGVAGRGGSTDGLISGAPEQGRFYNSEISDVSEKTTAIYARMDFGQDDVGGVSVDGNYGVRVVSTDIESEGFLSRQAITGDTVAALAASDPVLLAFFNSGNAAEARTIENGETYVLPSFNLKLGLTDDLILRFAAAQAISRPDVGSLRAYQQLQARTSTIAGPPLTPGGQPTIAGVTTNLTIQGGNPRLKPVRSNNLDASLEYYFSDVGSLTVSGFYKDLSDVIVNGLETGETFTLDDGRVLNFNYLGPINGADGKVKGVEVAYQQFYDFLPGALSGLGLQANYTYVDQDAIPNGGVRSIGAVSRDVDRFVLTDLENLSKHTVNVVGLYENDKIEARMAYNWRSDFLLTTVDVITRLPVYNESTGQLDASFKYNITDQFQIGVQGVNLLSEVTETSVQIDDAGQRLTRALFENDRRISLTGRFTF